jgi:hypothetical protein
MPQVVGAVVVITVAVGALAFNFAQDRKTNVGTAKAWEIQGPPCPTLTAVQFTAQHFTAKKTFDYDGITIGRAAGDASCSDVKASGGKGLATDKVCQFTSPVTLTVASKGGSYYFAPDVGHPASLMIHGDVPRCVMASNFTLKNEN